MRFGIFNIKFNYEKVFRKHYEHARGTLLTITAAIGVIDAVIYSLSIWSVRIDTLVYIVIVLSPAIVMCITKNPYRAIGAIAPTVLFMLWQIHYINFVEFSGSGVGDAITIGIVPIVLGIPLSIILSFGIGTLMTDSYEDDIT